MAKIQIKRGLQAAVTNLVLAEGELALATDTGNMYIGGSAGTIHINPAVGNIPTKVSQLSNDSNYQTIAQVNAAISALIASSPQALDTLNELALALGNDANFATTTANALAGKEPLLKNAPAKTAIVDADAILLIDSATGGESKKITFAQLKTVLNTLYNNYTLPTASAAVSGGVKVGNGLNISGGVLTVGDIDGGVF